MLGPQGSRAEKPECDPEKVSSFEPAASPVVRWLYVVGAVAMGGASALIAVFGDTSFVMRWVLGLGAVFFLYVALMGARRARKGRPASFDSQGLWIDGPETRKVIAWDNIEQVSFLAISSQRLTIISLRDPQQLIEQYNEAEAKVALRDENAIGAMATAMAMPVGSHAQNLLTMFAKRRKQWGGEIWLGPLDRDRGAEEFNDLIEAWRRKYASLGTLTPAPRTGPHS